MRCEILWTYYQAFTTGWGHSLHSRLIRTAALFPPSITSVLLNVTSSYPPTNWTQNPFVHWVPKDYPDPNQYGGRLLCGFQDTSSHRRRHQEFDQNACYVLLISKNTSDAVLWCFRWNDFSIVFVEISRQRCTCKPWNINKTRDV